MTGQARLFAVVGDPVARSLSPRLHQGWLDKAGLNARYLALPLKTFTPEADLKALFRAGLGGLNVTLPYKAAALASSVGADPLAHRLGAANTLVRGEAGWIAHNTDLGGFARALAGAGAPEAGRALLIGAGGAARAAALAVSEAGYDLTIANRTKDKAEALIADLGLSGAEAAGLDAIAVLSRSMDLIVNAASFGHAGVAPFPLAAPASASALAFDLSYGEAARPFLDLAAHAGWRTEDGLSMLVHQGADAFALWFGVEPDRADGLARLRAALSEAA